MNANHSPGPWRLSETVRDTVVSDSDSSRVNPDDLSYYGRRLIAESVFREADRRLIAAAPLLLDALKDAEQRMRSYLILLKCDDEFIANETAMSRTAIAAATN